MADLNVQFREEERIPVTFQTENAYHWDVVFRGNEALQPIVFSPQDRSMPVTFHEDGINGEIFGGVNYIVHDYGDLPIATKQRLGCIIVGENLDITPEGTLSATGEADMDPLSNLEIEELLGGS